MGMTKVKKNKNDRNQSQEVYSTTTVALLKCKSYQLQNLKKQIAAGLNLTGIDPKIFKQQRVLLKPNLLMAASAEKAITTHPEFFRAVAQIVKSHGGRPIVAENPAITRLDQILPKVGYDRIIEEEGIEIGRMQETRILHYKKARKFKRFEISQAFFHADIIINLPKFKTHGITYVTGAVKNLFGVIPGLLKSQWHTKAPNAEEFSEMILDLNEALLKGFQPPKRFLHIMDAIVGMEGEGPGPTGRPREIGAIIIGENPIAVDYAAVKVVGLEANKVRTITSGLTRGLGISNLDEIRMVGEPMENMKIDHFQPTRHSIFGNLVSRWPFTSNTVRNWITEKPVPQPENCTLCLKCMEICPAKAITRPGKKGKRPAFDYDKCIRCYCCMEICPQAAIGLKKGRLQWMIEKTSLS